MCLLTNMGRLDLVVPAVRSGLGLFKPRSLRVQPGLGGLPVPALVSALGDFDSYRRRRGTANIIQAQRRLVSRSSGCA